MNTIYSMLLATVLFVTINVAMADVPEGWTYEESDEICVVVNNYAYCEGDQGYEQANQLIEDCLSDYVLDWESDSCDFMRPTDYEYDRDEYDEFEMVAELP